MLTTIVADVPAASRRTMSANLDRRRANMSANGLLINGQRVLVPKLTIIGPGDAEWCALDPGDYRERGPNDWIRQIIIHTTKGDWPQAILQEHGSGGKAERTA